MTFGALIYVYLNNVGLLAFKKWFDLGILGFSGIGQLFSTFLATLEEEVKQAMI